MMEQGDLTGHHPALEVAAVELRLEPVGLQPARLPPVHHLAPHLRQLGELAPGLRHHLTVGEQPHLIITNIVQYTYNLYSFILTNT